MDRLARFNKARWEELSGAGISYGKPWLDLNEKRALDRVDSEHVLGDIKGREVLCLAAGGGQQSAAFALLGARVTVVDFSEQQLEKDTKTAAYYGLKINAIQGDMRDLSFLPRRAFDIVWQAHSLNFVPNATDVFRQVSLVVRKKSYYRLHFANPFVFGLWLEEWNGRGYSLHRSYTDGPFRRRDPHWYFDAGKGNRKKVTAPKEFVHSLSTIINGLNASSFRIRGLWEDNSGNFRAKPGSWEHFKAIAPPWLTVLCEYAP